MQIGDDVVGVRIAIRDIAEGQEHGPESQIYNWNIKKDISLDGAQPVKNDSSRDVSSDISIYNISKTQEKVNNDYIEKEASSQEDNASFFDGYELYENNPTTADAVPLPLGKGDVKLNPDEVIEGIWEDSPNRDKNIVEKSQLESVENLRDDDIIYSGAISGARNPNGEKAKAHADKYYGLVRSMKTDVSKISNNSGFSKQQIQNVKNYIFNDKHNLGGKELEMFAPDFMMAESWKRLIEGNVQPHDMTLLLHEIMEMELVEKGISQAEAHLMATKKYNYNKEAKEFYDKIKKYKD